MTTPASTVVKTITEAETRDVTHCCHFIAAARQQKLMQQKPSLSAQRMDRGMRLRLRHLPVLHSFANAKAETHPAVHNG